jgi:hypothetical protein
MSATPASTGGAPQQTPAAKHALFEPLALVLLSLATVGTAWCSYEATGWVGASSRAGSLSANKNRDAMVLQLQANQVLMVDIALFTQYINARAASNGPLAQFYAERFRDEAKAAFHAWMSLDPFQNSNAPLHPFVTNLYHSRLLVQAASLQEEAAQLSHEAGEAGRVSRSYALMTVLLASALFCGGTASKFDQPWIRRGVLALGLGAFVFTAVKLWTLPVQP